MREQVYSSEVKNFIIKTLILLIMMLLSLMASILYMFAYPTTTVILYDATYAVPEEVSRHLIRRHSKLANIPPLEKEGYTFSHYTYEDGTMFNPDLQIDDEVLNLYGTFTINTYKITFNVQWTNPLTGKEEYLQNVTGCKPMEDIPYGTSVTLPTGLDRHGNLNSVFEGKKGYTFKGWTTKVTENEDEVEYIKAGGEFVVPAGNVEFYAYWERNSYNIMLNTGIDYVLSNGGTLDKDITASLDGLTTSLAKDNEGNYKITNDVGVLSEFRLKFKDSLSGITEKYENYQLNANVMKVGVNNDKLGFTNEQFREFANEYNFLGWYLDKDYTIKANDYDFILQIDGDDKPYLVYDVSGTERRIDAELLNIEGDDSERYGFNLYSKWERKSYTLSFDKGASRGNKKIQPITVYKYDTLYGKYYNVGQNANCDTVSDYTRDGSFYNRIDLMDEDITSETFKNSWSGYRFMGWSTTKNVDKTSTVYAKWSQNPYSFDIDKGVYSGGEFVYQNKEYVHLTGGDVTLYAQWQKMYNVTFAKERGSSAKFTHSVIVDEQILLYGSDYIANTCKWSVAYKEFAGWSTDPTSDNPAFEKTEYGTYNGVVSLNPNYIYTFSGKENVTLYAIWRPIKYKAVFHLNDGSGKTLTDPTYDVISGGVSKALPSVNPSRENFKFLGWTIDRKVNDKNNSEIQSGYTDNEYELKLAKGESVSKLYSKDSGDGSFIIEIVSGVPNFDTETNTINFYAVWSVNYTVEMHLDEGTSAKHYEYDNKNYSKLEMKIAKIGEGLIPTKEGYVFSGWKVKSPEGEYYPETITSGAQVTFNFADNTVKYLYKNTSQTKNIKLENDQRTVILVADWVPELRDLKFYNTQKGSSVSIPLTYDVEYEFYEDETTLYLREIISQNNYGAPIKIFDKVAGYYFEGWATVEGGTAEYGIEEGQTKTINGKDKNIIDDYPLYAVFVQKEIGIDFHYIDSAGNEFIFEEVAGTGKSKYAQTIYYGSALTKYPDQNPVGATHFGDGRYSFRYWYYMTKDADGQDVEIIVTSTTKIFYKDSDSLVLYAKFTPDEYTIKFLFTVPDGNVGESVTYEIDNVIKNTKVGDLIADNQIEEKYNNFVNTNNIKSHYKENFVLQANQNTVFDSDININGDNFSQLNSNDTITIVIKWASAENITVRYDFTALNKGYVNLFFDKVSITHNDSIRLSDEHNLGAGVKITSWYIEKNDGTQKTFNANGYLINNGARLSTLKDYIVWESDNNSQTNYVGYLNIKPKTKTVFTINYYVYNGGQDWNLLESKNVDEIATTQVTLRNVYSYKDFAFEGWIVGDNEYQAGEKITISNESFPDYQVNIYAKMSFKITAKYLDDNFDEQILTETNISLNDLYTQRGSFPSVYYLEVNSSEFNGKIPNSYELYGIKYNEDLIKFVDGRLGLNINLSATKTYLGYIAKRVEFKYMSDGSVFRGDEYLVGYDKVVLNKKGDDSITTMQIISDIPTKKDYIFKGWQIGNEANLREPNSNIITTLDDLEFTAIFEKIAQGSRKVILEYTVGAITFQDTIENINGKNIKLPTLAEIQTKTQGHEISELWDQDNLRLVRWLIDSTEYPLGGEYFVPLDTEDGKVIIVGSAFRNKYIINFNYSEFEDDMLVEDKRNIEKLIPYEYDNSSKFRLSTTAQVNGNSFAHWKVKVGEEWIHLDGYYLAIKDDVSNIQSENIESGKTIYYIPNDYFVEDVNNNNMFTLTLYAVWSYADISITAIVINPNNSNETVQQTFTIPHNSTKQVEDFIPESLNSADWGASVRENIKGWTKTLGGSTADFVLENITEGATIYAVLAPSYNVTYANANADFGYVLGGEKVEISPVSAIKKFAGDEISFNKAIEYSVYKKGAITVYFDNGSYIVFTDVNSGNYFIVKGYRVVSEDGVLNESFGLSDTFTMPESNIEITPIFEETHRVQFTSLGESLDKEEYSFKLVDGKLNLSNYSNIVSRTNYKLVGWSDGVTEYRYTFDTDGVTITNSDSLIVTVSDNVVFSAIWETSMEVEFKLNNSANNTLFRITLNEYGKIDKTSLESLLNAYKFPLDENSDTYEFDEKLYYSNKTFTINGVAYSIDTLCDKVFDSSAITLIIMEDVYTVNYLKSDNSLLVSHYLVKGGQITSSGVNAEYRTPNSDVAELGEKVAVDWVAGDGLLNLDFNSIANISNIITQAKNNNNEITFKINWINKTYKIEIKYLSGTNSEMLQGFENNVVNYTSQTFKYAYKTQGEQFIGNVNVEKGKTIYLASPQVVPSYYKFVGWTTEDDLKLGETPATIFAPNGGYASVTTTGEMTFYPVFKASTKEVTLSVSNGSISYSVSVDGAKGVVFADESYKLVGNVQSFDSSTKSMGIEIPYYATIKLHNPNPNKYYSFSKFIVDGEDVADNEVEVTVGYSNSEVEVEFKNAIKNITIKIVNNNSLKDASKEYKFTFKSNNDKELVVNYNDTEDKTLEVYENGIINLTFTNGLKDFYDISAESSYNVSSIVDNTITITLLPKYVSIAFNLNGGEVSGVKVESAVYENISDITIEDYTLTTQVVYGAKVNLTNPTKQDHTFAGWFVGGVKVQGNIYTVTTNTTFVADYVDVSQKIITVINLIKKPTGSIEKQESTFFVTNNEKITVEQINYVVSNIANSYITFDNLVTSDENGNNTFDYTSDESEITEDTTIYLHYTAVYQIAYNYTGFTTSETISNKTITSRTLEKSNYEIIVDNFTANNVSLKPLHWALDDEENFFDGGNITDAILDYATSGVITLKLLSETKTFNVKVTIKFYDSETEILVENVEYGKDLATAVNSYIASSDKTTESSLDGLVNAKKLANPVYPTPSYLGYVEIDGERVDTYNTYLVKSDISVEVKYVPETYSVTFATYLQNGSDISAINLDSKYKIDNVEKTFNGSKSEELTSENIIWLYSTNVETTGYTFLGWRVLDGDQAKDLEDGYFYKKSGNNVQVGSDITIIALFKIQYATVRFNIETTKINDDIQNVGAKYKLSTEQTFITKTNVQEFEWDVQVGKTITVAGFISDEKLQYYKLSNIVCGATSNPLQLDIYVDANKEITLVYETIGMEVYFSVTPPINGMSLAFNNLTYIENGVSKSTTPKKLTSTISNGGKTYNYMVVVPYGSTILAGPDKYIFTINNFTFSGWGASLTANSEVKETKYLIANFTANDVTIKFQDDTTTISTITSKYGETITLPYIVIEKGDKVSYAWGYGREEKAWGSDFNLVVSGHAQTSEFVFNAKFENMYYVVFANALTTEGIEIFDIPSEYPLSKNDSFRIVKNEIIIDKGIEFTFIKDGNAETKSNGIKYQNFVSIPNVIITAKTGYTKYQFNGWKSNYRNIYNYGDVYSYNANDILGNTITLTAQAKSEYEFVLLDKSGNKMTIYQNTNNGLNSTKAELKFLTETLTGYPIITISNTPDDNVTDKYVATISYDGVSYYAFMDSCNYIFSGWKTYSENSYTNNILNSDLSNSQNIAMNYVYNTTKTNNTEKFEKLLTMSNTSSTFYALWEEKNIVHFDTNSDGVQDDDEQVVAIGVLENYEMPREDFDGYIHLGWEYGDKQFLFERNDKFVINSELLNVMFSNGGNGIVLKPITKQAINVIFDLNFETFRTYFNNVTGDTIGYPKIDKKHGGQDYSFSGYGDIITIESVDFYKQYILDNKLNINDYIDLNSAYVDMEFAYECSTNYQNDYDKHFKLLGWALEQNSEDLVNSYQVTNTETTITFYAIWDIKQVEVSFVKDNGSNEKFIHSTGLAIKHNIDWGSTLSITEGVDGSTYIYSSTARELEGVLVDGELVYTKLGESDTRKFVYWSVSGKDENIFNGTNKSFAITESIEIYPKFVSRYLIKYNVNGDILDTNLYKVNKIIDNESFNVSEQVNKLFGNENISKIYVKKIDDSELGIDEIGVFDSTILKINTNPSQDNYNVVFVYIELMFAINEYIPNGSGVYNSISPRLNKANGLSEATMLGKTFYSWFYNEKPEEVDMVNNIPADSSSDYFKFVRTFVSIELQYTVASGVGSFKWIIAYSDKTYESTDVIVDLYAQFKVKTTFTIDSNLGSIDIVQKPSNIYADYKLNSGVLEYSTIYLAGITPDIKVTPIYGYVISKINGGTDIVTFNAAEMRSLTIEDYAQDFENKYSIVYNKSISKVDDELQSTEIINISNQVSGKLDIGIYLEVLTYNIEYKYDSTYGLLHYKPSNSVNETGVLIEQVAEGKTITVYTDMYARETVKFGYIFNCQIEQEIEYYVYTILNVPYGTNLYIYIDLKPEFEQQENWDSNVDLGGKLYYHQLFTNTLGGQTQQDGILVDTIKLSTSMLGKKITSVKFILQIEENNIGTDTYWTELTKEFFTKVGDRYELEWIPDNISIDNNLRTGSNISGLINSLNKKYFETYNNKYGVTGFARLLNYYWFDGIWSTIPENEMSEGKLDSSNIVTTYNNCLVLRTTLDKASVMTIDIKAIDYVDYDNDGTITVIDDIVRGKINSILVKNGTEVVENAYIDTDEDGEKNINLDGEYLILDNSTEGSIKVKLKYDRTLEANVSANAGDTRNTVAHSDYQLIGAEVINGSFANGTNSFFADFTGIEGVNNGNIMVKLGERGFEGSGSTDDQFNDNLFNSITKKPEVNIYVYVKPTTYVVNFYKFYGDTNELQSVRLAYDDGVYAKDNEEFKYYSSLFSVYDWYYNDKLNNLEKFAIPKFIGATKGVQDKKSKPFHNEPEGGSYPYGYKYGYLENIFHYWLFNGDDDIVNNTEPIIHYIEDGVVILEAEYVNNLVDVNYTIKHATKSSTDEESLTLKLFENNFRDVFDFVYTNNLYLQPAFDFYEASNSQFDCRVTNVDDAYGYKEVVHRELNEKYGLYNSSRNKVTQVTDLKDDYKVYPVIAYTISEVFFMNLDKNNATEYSTTTLYAFGGVYTVSYTNGKIQFGNLVGAELGEDLTGAVDNGKREYESSGTFEHMYDLVGRLGNSYTAVINFAFWKVVFDGNYNASSGSVDEYSDIARVSTELSYSAESGAKYSMHTNPKIKFVKDLEDSDIGGVVYRNDYNLSTSYVAIDTTPGDQNDIIPSNIFINSSIELGETKNIKIVREEYNANYLSLSIYEKVEQKWEQIYSVYCNKIISNMFNDKLKSYAWVILDGKGNILKTLNANGDYFELNDSYYGIQIDLVCTEEVAIKVGDTGVGANNNFGVSYNQDPSKENSVVNIVEQSIENLYSINNKGTSVTSAGGYLTVQDVKIFNSTIHYNKENYNLVITDSLENTEIVIEFDDSKLDSELLGRLEGYYWQYSVDGSVWTNIEAEVYTQIATEESELLFRVVGIHKMVKFEVTDKISNQTEYNGQVNLNAFKNNAVSKLSNYIIQERYNTTNGVETKVTNFNIINSYLYIPVGTEITYNAENISFVCDYGAQSYWVNISYCVGVTVDLVYYKQGLFRYKGVDGGNSGYKLQDLTESIVATEDVSIFPWLESVVKFDFEVDMSEYPDVVNGYGKIVYTETNVKNKQITNIYNVCTGKVVGNNERYLYNAENIYTGISNIITIKPEKDSGETDDCGICDDLSIHQVNHEYLSMSYGNQSNIENVEDLSADIMLKNNMNPYNPSLIVFKFLFDATPTISHIGVDVDRELGVDTYNKDRNTTSQVFDVYGKYVLKYVYNEDYELEVYLYNHFANFEGFNFNRSYEGVFYIATKPTGLDSEGGYDKDYITFYPGSGYHLNKLYTCELEYEIDLGYGIPTNYEGAILVNEVNNQAIIKGGKSLIFYNAYTEKTIDYSVVIAKFDVKLYEGNSEINGSIGKANAFLVKDNSVIDGQFVTLFVFDSDVFDSEYMVESLPNATVFGDDQSLSLQSNVDSLGIDIDLADSKYKVKTGTNYNLKSVKVSNPLNESIATNYDMSKVLGELVSTDINYSQYTIKIDLEQRTTTKINLLTTLTDGDEKEITESKQSIVFNDFADGNVLDINSAIVVNDAEFVSLKIEKTSYGNDLIIYKGTSEYIRISLSINLNSHYSINPNTSFGWQALTNEGRLTSELEKLSLVGYDDIKYDSYKLSNKTNEEIGERVYNLDTNLLEISKDFTLVLNIVRNPIEVTVDDGAYWDKYWLEDTSLDSALNDEEYYNYLTSNGVKHIFVGGKVEFKANKNQIIKNQETLNFTIKQKTDIYINDLNDNSRSVTLYKDNYMYALVNRLSDKYDDLDDNPLIDAEDNTVLSLFESDKWALIRVPNEDHTNERKYYFYTQPADLSEGYTLDDSKISEGYAFGSNTITLPEFKGVTSGTLQLGKAKNGYYRTRMNVFDECYGELENIVFKKSDNSTINITSWEIIFFDDDGNTFVAYRHAGLFVYNISDIAGDLGLADEDYTAVVFNPWNETKLIDVEFDEYFNLYNKTKVPAYILTEDENGLYSYKPNILRLRIDKGLAQKILTNYVSSNTYYPGTDKYTNTATYYVLMYNSSVITAFNIDYGNNQKEQYDFLKINTNSDNTIYRLVMSNMDSSGYILELDLTRATGNKISITSSMQQLGYTVNYNPDNTYDASGNIIANAIYDTGMQIKGKYVSKKLGASTFEPLVVNQTSVNYLTYLTSMPYRTFDGYVYESEIFKSNYFSVAAYIIENGGAYTNQGVLTTSDKNDIKFTIYHKAHALKLGSDQTCVLGTHGYNETISCKFCESYYFSEHKDYEVLKAYIPNSGLDMGHKYYEICGGCWQTCISNQIVSGQDYYRVNYEGYIYHIIAEPSSFIEKCRLNNVECKERGHTSSEWIIDEKSTCCTMGVKHKECIYCGYTTESQDISLTYHTICKETTACSGMGFVCYIDPSSYIHYHTYDMETYHEISVNGKKYPYMYDYVDDSNHWKVVVAGYKCAHYKYHEKQGITPFYHYKHSNFGDQNENAYKNQTTYKQNSFYFYGGCLCDDCLDWSNRNTDKYNDNFIIDGLGSGSTFDFNRVKKNYSWNPYQEGVSQVLGMGKFVMIDYKENGKLIDPPSLFNSIGICENHNTTNLTDMTTCVNYGKACDCGFVVQASEYDKAYKGTHRYIVYAYYPIVDDSNPLTCCLLYDRNHKTFVKNYILKCELCGEIKHIKAEDYLTSTYIQSNCEIRYGEHYHLNEPEQYIEYDTSLNNDYRFVRNRHINIPNAPYESWVAITQAELREIVGDEVCDVCGHNIQIVYTNDGYINWYATTLSAIDYTMVNWEDAFFEYLLNILGIKNYCDYVTPAGPLADSYYCLSISAETLSLNATPLTTVDGNFMLMFNLAGVIWSDLTGSNFVHVVLTQETTESYSLDHAIDISSKNSVRKKED